MREVRLLGGVGGVGGKNLLTSDDTHAYVKFCVDLFFG